MNEHLRDRVLRKLETLSDERAYQVLDYIEFLESKYAERAPAAASIFTRFSEAVEDRLRAGKVSASAIAETMGLMNRAMNVLNGVAAAGRSVANDIATATSNRTPPGPGAGGSASGAAPGSAAATPPTPRPAPPGGSAGATVAGSGTAGGAAPPSPPAPDVVDESALNDPRATESGELDPPLGR